MKRNISIAIAIVISLAISYGLGRYTSPAKVVVKEKIVEKVIEVERKNVETITTETKKPDGTVIKEKRTLDLSVTETQAVRRQETSKVVEAAKPQWRIGVGVGLQQDIRGVVYTGRVERRIFGPVFAGVDVGFQQRYVGAAISVEF